MFSPSRKTKMPEAPQANWFTSADEGQLSVDVYREDNQLVIRSIVAGVRPADIEISIHGDLLTIRGVRQEEKRVSQDDWFYRECYWGRFSRSIVLPYEVVTEAAQARLKHGVLEISVPIREHAKKVPVRWEE